MAREEAEPIVKAPVPSKQLLMNANEKELGSIPLHVSNAFNAMDSEGKGFITSKDVGSLLETMGEAPTKHNIVMALYTMGTPKGAITLSQFCEYYQKHFLVRKGAKSFMQRQSKALGVTRNTRCTLPPESFCFGKKLQRDEEGVGLVLQHRELEAKPASRNAQGHGKKDDSTPLFSSANDAKIRESSSTPAETRKKSFPRAAILSPPSPGVACIIFHITRQLKKQGIKSIVSLRRKLRGASEIHGDNTSQVSLSDFKNVLGEMKFDVSAKDMRLLFEFIDPNQEMSVDYELFFDLLRVPMKQNRKLLVQRVLARLLKDHFNTVSIVKVIDAYDPSGHPDVALAIKTVEEIREEFFDALEVQAMASDQISKTELLDYFSMLSSIIDSDEYFEEVVTGTWHLDESPTLASSVANTTTGSKDLRSAMKPLEIISPDRMQANETMAVFKPVVVATPYYGRKATQWQSNDSTGSLFNYTTSVPIKIISSSQKPNKPSPLHSRASVGAVYDLKKIKNAILGKGLKCMFQVQKMLSENNDSMQEEATLTSSDFVDALKTLGIDVHATDVRHLFSWMDAGCEVSRVPKKDLLAALIDELEPNHLTLLRDLYTSMEKKLGGKMLLAKVKELFCASKHPHVVLGSKLEKEVEQEFHDTFLPSARPDSILTPEDWVSYHRVVVNTLEKQNLLLEEFLKTWNVGSKKEEKEGEEKRLLPMGISNRLTSKVTSTATQSKKGPRERAKKGSDLVKKNPTLTTSGRCNKNGSSSAILARKTRDKK